MADTNPALETTQVESINILRIIRNELMMQNGFSESANQDRKDLLVAEEQIKQQMIDDAAAKAKAEAEAAKEALANRSIVAKTNDFLKRMLGNSDWVKENTLRMQKAMKSALIDKPSAMMKGLADKTSKFATDILKLLLTGGILFGLYKLLEWLATQNPMELYNKAVAAFDNFNKEYGGFIDGILRLSASVAIWKTAEFLGGAGKGALWALWTSIKTIFGAGGKFFVLAASATGWAGSALFGEEGALRKTWGAVKKIFGAAGLFFDLFQIVGKWAGSVIFDIAKAPIVLIWNELTRVFGTEGKIGKLFTEVVDKFKDFTGFGPDGAFRKMWKGITTFFGAEGKIAKVVTDVVDKFTDFIGFGPDGSFQKLWKGITGFFGPGGKIAKSPGFLLTAEELVDLKFAGLDEAGPFKTMFKRIKAIFGPEGKIAKGFLFLQDTEDFVGDQSDIRGLFKFLKNWFGAEGKIANGFKTIKNLIPDFTGEKGIVTKVFNFIDGIFGESSKFSTLSTALSGWFEKFKNFFSFSDDAGKGGAISKLFGFIGGIADTIGGTVKAITDSAVFKGIKKVFGVAASVASKAAVWIGKIFAPIGWIMGFVEAVTGFWDGFKSKGEGDDRSFAQKVMDGLKGAIKGLVDFLVIDTVMLIQDIVNFGIKAINGLAEVTITNPFTGNVSKFNLFDPFEEVTFGEDLQKMSDELINSISPDTGKGFGVDVVEERVPVGTQSGAQVNVASQVQQVTENNRTSLKKESVEKFQKEAKDE